MPLMHRNLSCLHSGITRLCVIANCKTTVYHISIDLHRFSCSFIQPSLLIQWGHHYMRFPVANRMTWYPNGLNLWYVAMFSKLKSVYCTRILVMSLNDTSLLYIFFNIVIKWHFTRLPRIYPELILTLLTPELRASGVLVSCLCLRWLLRIA